MGMKVNFNNLRKQTAYRYDNLTQKLNKAEISLEIAWFDRDGGKG